jgi:hypothetical protein
MIWEYENKTILFRDILQEMFETPVDEYPLYQEKQLDWADVFRTKYISKSTDCMESVRDLIYYRVIVVWSHHKLVTAKTLIIE